MPEVSSYSRSNRLQQFFLSLSQNIRVHGVEFLESVKSDIGGEFFWSFVLNIGEVTVMMMVRVEDRVFVGHVNQGQLFLSEGVHRWVLCGFSLTHQIIIKLSALTNFHFFPPP